MLPITRTRQQCHHGFSLIELMIAMAIGLFGVLIMVQVFSMSEANKRVSTSGNDAMNEGVVSLYAVQREVRMAGFGIADTRILGCNLLLRAGVTLVAMAPVTINHASIPAGDTNTDTLLVVYANTDGSPQGDLITAAPAADQFTVQTNAAFAVNDWVVVAPFIRTCATTAAPLTPSLTLTQVASIAAPSITVTAGTGEVLPAVVMPLYPTVFNFGQRMPRVMAYAIRSGNLTVCDYSISNCGATGSVGDAAVWVPIGSNIVSLRAQYGRDTAAAGAMDGAVDVYDQTTPTTACGWVRISALRLALVARSAQPAAAATTAAPVWDGSANAPIDLTGNTAWQNYRYKVFQTVAPLRNIAWMGRVTGC